MANKYLCQCKHGRIHVEEDVTYTSIVVPEQNSKLQKFHGNKYEFLFMLNETNIIALPMIENVSFIFSGIFLVHCQNGNESKKKDESVFINLSSYGNKKLFNHMRKSFFRNLIEKIN